MQIRQVRWIDPATDHDAICDVRLEDGQVTPVDALDNTLPTLDGAGLWLLPGFVDLGHELLASGVAAGRDMASELRAARRCGFAEVCAAPDTTPLIDGAAAVEWIEHRAGGPAGARLRLLGALTQGLDGQQLSNMAALKAAGCAGLSQGRAALPEAGLLRQCLRYAADLDMTVHLAPQLPALNAGCAHDGDTATALGLAGIPVAAETAATALLLALAEDTGCRLHFSRLSSAAAAQRVVEARGRGLTVTADVAIWHLLHDQTAVDGYNSAFHLQPPLRDDSDRRALLSLLRDGQIDAICSQHRALDQDAKFGPFAETVPGANGIDGYAAQLLQLVERGELTPIQLARATATAPAAILSGSATAGGTVHWMLLDPAREWQLNTQTKHSAGHHSPLQGNTLRGAVAGWLENDQAELYDSWQNRLGV